MKVTARYCVAIFTLISAFTFIVLTIFYPELEFFSKNDADDLIGPPVYFLETNAIRRYMSQVSACSVESAAKHNPRSPVVFYKLGSDFDPQSPLLLRLRQNYPNIRITPLHPDQLFRGTPLQNENGTEDEMSQKILKSWFPEDHMSDVARAALLWKQGGVYLVTDVIVRSPLDTFANYISIELDFYGLHFGMVNTHVMAFERNSEFLHNHMAILRDLFPYISFHRNAPGPILISILLLLECGGLLMPLNAPEKCGGINVNPLETYNTVNFYNAFHLFEQPESNAFNLTEAGVVHLSQSRFKGRSTAVGSGSYLDLIFKENCPVVYEQIRGTIIL